MIETRQATIADVSWILEELLEFSQFYGTKKSLFGSHEHATDYVTNIVENHFVLVSETDDKNLTGFIAGLIVNHPFNPDIKLLQELWWWVPEKYRGGRSGLKLFKDFSAFGDRYCDWTVFTLEDSSPVSDRMLLKTGFKIKETTYLRESTWQQ